MTLLILYLSTFAVFLVVDYFALGYLIKPIFEQQIGHLMLQDIRIGPAFAFYAFFVGVVLWFVSWPALQQDKSVLWVLGNAALIGAEDSELDEPTGSAGSVVATDGSEDASGAASGGD